MERDFGVKLFKRTTRSVSMTEAGLSYFNRCESLVDEARVAHEALRDVATQPKGHLRISIPVDLGMYEIGPLFSDFLQQYPDISFDIDLSSREVNLAYEHVDFALQIGEVKQKSLFVRHIGSVAQGLFASPGYLHRHGQPVHPADLAGYECIMFKGELEAIWSLQRNAQVVEVAVRAQQPRAHARARQERHGHHRHDKRTCARPAQRGHTGAGFARMDGPLPADPCVHVVAYATGSHENVSGLSGSASVDALIARGQGPWSGHLPPTVMRVRRGLHGRRDAANQHK